MSFYHSVTLDTDKCVGCTNCIKRCPTEAIRVRDGKAVITTERCIDCGECIRVCPHHAKKAIYSHLNDFDKFKYKIALPAPSLYGQFNNLDDVDYVLTGLKKIGFDYVFEVAIAAELVSEATRQIMKDPNIQKPIISSACPAVVRLIRVRFPDLCSHVLQFNSPMEIAAKIAKERVAKEQNIDKSEIACIFITPCPAKVSEIKSPVTLEKSDVDGAVAISDIYPLLSSKMDKLTETENLSHSGIIGVSWATSGGESVALLKEKYLAADGIEHVIKVLEEIEDERIGDVDFVELNACTGGCVGGVLCVENPFVAKARIQSLRKYLPVAKNHLDTDIDINELMHWTVPLKYSDVLTLSSDLKQAMRMMVEIGNIEEKLPGLDCGACGSPSCRAFAEDILKGYRKETDCVFIIKKLMEEKLGKLM